MSVRSLARQSGLSRAARNLHLTTVDIAGRLDRSTTPPVDRARLRVVAHVPSYPPAVRAGSEISLHEVLRDLVGRGHEVRVICTDVGDPGTFDGVQVSRATGDLVAAYRWSNVIVTQLSARSAAMRLARRMQRPIVHFVRLGPIDPMASFGRPELVVYNSAWLQRTHVGRGRTTVLHSPIDAARYRTEPGQEITAVNLSDAKGGRTFFDLARRLPDRPFLGVRGAWGDQMVPDVVPGNVTIVDTTSDMRAVYRRTRILLVPSQAETFGRIAVEAGCSGIPIVAHPADGTREVLGDAGLWARREDIDRWVDHIQSLDDPVVYSQRGALVRSQVERWTTDAELVAFEQTMLDVVRSF